MNHAAVSPRHVPESRVLAGRGLTLTVLSAVALLAAATAGAALQPLAPAQPLNMAAPCDQDDPDVAPLSGGGFMAVWRGETAGGAGIAARRLDADGMPLGEEMTLRLADSPGRPRVQPAPDDGFAVSWTEAGATAAEARLLVQAFAADGAPRTPPVEVAAGPAATFHHDLAAHPDGRAAVVWTDGTSVRMRLLEADLTPRSEILEVADGDPGSVRIGRPAVVIATHPTIELVDDALVVWDEGPPGGAPSFERVLGRIYVHSAGEPVGEAFTIRESASGSPVSLTPAVATLPALGYVVAWAGLIPDGGFLPEIEAQLLDGLGGPFGEPIRVQAGDGSTTFDPTDPDLAVLGRDRFAIAWRTRVPPPPVDPLPPGVGPFSVGQVRVFEFGAAQGDALILSEERHESKPALAAAPSAHRLVAVTRQHALPAVAEGCSEEAAILARGFRVGCIEGDRRLCLAGGRFAVEVAIDDPRLDPPFPRAAFPSPLTADSGTFWFSRPANVELMVKLLDGRAVNGHWWFFSGALTDLGHEIVVTDTVTGTERRYLNLPGELASRADTRAFADASPAGGSIGAERPAPLLASAGPEPPAEGDAGPLAAATSGGCSDGDPSVLCLHLGRIRVRLEWHDPRSGAAGSATAALLSAESGWFWIFRPDNAEVLIKVLDGRTVNGHWWVFVAGLTDLELTVVVEDVETEAEWTYHNPPFVLRSHADTAALPAP